MSVEQIKDFLVFAIMWFMYWLVFFHTSGLKVKKRYILPVGIGLLLLDYFYQLATYPFTFLIFSLFTTIITLEKRPINTFFIVCFPLSQLTSFQERLPCTY